MAERKLENLCEAIMFFNLALVVFLSLATLASSQHLNFTYNGFRSSNLALDGVATVTRKGFLELTNRTKQQTGHAFYKDPVRFKPPSSNRTVFSFSTVFVFAIRPEIPSLSGHGIAFVISPTRGLPGSLASQYLGLFNGTNNGNNTNRVFAVELDTVQSNEFEDINDNHVGIDINGLKSVKSAPAGYYSDKDGKFKGLNLFSGDPMLVWIDYNGLTKRIEVSMAPIGGQKPIKPLLSTVYDLSQVLNETMYIGFSSATGSVLSQHYVLGWSFRMNREAEPPSRLELQNFPRFDAKRLSKFYKFGIPLILISIFAVILGLIYTIRRRRKFAEVADGCKVLESLLKTLNELLSCILKSPK